MTFTLGTAYSRKMIHAACGGDLHSELPNRKGLVVATCLDAHRQPHAPTVILCDHRNTKTARASALLIQQTAPLPVFIKRVFLRWRYQGLFKVTGCCTDPEECAPYIAGSGRDPTEISRVVILERA